MDAAECRSLIRLVDQGQPERATVDTGAPGGELKDDLRNNRRVTVDDSGLADKLYQRAKPHLPDTLFGMDCCGLNERLRYYLYEPGQYFRLHRDGYYQRDARQRSHLTFMVYLNGDFEGGETAFPELNESVTPAEGLAVFFQHRALHESVVLTMGTKYVLRSDVMFRDAH